MHQGFGLRRGYLGKDRRIRRAPPHTWRRALLLLRVERSRERVEGVEAVRAVERDQMVQSHATRRSAEREGVEEAVSVREYLDQEAYGADTVQSLLLRQSPSIRVRGADRHRRGDRPVEEEKLARAVARREDQAWQGIQGFRVLRGEKRLLLPRAAGEEQKRLRHLGGRQFHRYPRRFQLSYGHGEDGMYLARGRLGQEFRLDEARVNGAQSLRVDRVEPVHETGAPFRSQGRFEASPQGLRRDAFGL